MSTDHNEKTMTTSEMPNEIWVNKGRQGRFYSSAAYKKDNLSTRYIRADLQAQKPVDVEELENDILEYYIGNQPLTGIGGITAALNYLDKHGHLAATGRIVPEGD